MAPRCQGFIEKLKFRFFGFINFSMKSLKILIGVWIILLLANTGFAQDIAGHWQGKFNSTLHVNIEIVKADDGHEALISVPLQKSEDDPSVNFSRKGDSIFIDWKVPVKANFSGKYYPELDMIRGKWTQVGVTDLVLHKATEKYVLPRPQEPHEPFPYQVIDTNFTNVKADIKLAATLTLPENGTNVPAVVLVSGSGPQDRNSEILGHKSFKLIADFFTRNGIAVLRYDDRGFGESEGSFMTSTSLDFADDAEAGVSFLKSFSNIDPSKIGIVGHSEGGLIAPIVASRNSDVGFVVLMAGPGIEVSELMIEQSVAYHKLNYQSLEFLEKNGSFFREFYALIKTDAETKDLFAPAIELTNAYYETIPDDEKEVMGKSKEQLYMSLSQSVFNPWFGTFIKINPQKYLSQLQCPVLALNGTKDFQVKHDSNLAGIEKSLQAGGNTNFEIKEYKGLNHLFQEANTGAANEYGVLEETIHPVVLFDMMEWILGL